MKHLVIIISLFVIVSALPAVASADDWDAYVAYNSRYYFLDQQDFNTITCTVKSSTLTNMVNQIRKQLDPLAKNIELIANLDSFSVTYSKAAGVKVERPELDVRIKSVEGLDAPDRVKQGVSMIKTAFKQTINGLVMELEGIIEGYEAPVRKDYENIKLVEKDGKVTATYQRKSSTVTEIFSDNTVDLKEVSPGGDTHIVAKLETVADSKLVPKDVQITLHQQASTIESTMTMSYQKVGKVLFPKQITTKARMEAQSVKQEGQTEVTLSNCKID